MLKFVFTRYKFWIRLFGYGISGKNLKKHSLMFSERNGYTKTLRIFNWSFKLLRKL